MIEILATRHAYVAFTLLLCIGIYIMIADKNLVKKIIGLNLFQTAVFLLFIASAYVEGGNIPIVPHGEVGGETFVSPLPQVLVLTAIVVGVSLTAVGLALCIRIYEEYGTLRTDALREAMREEDVLPGEKSEEHEPDVVTDGGAVAGDVGSATDGVSDRGVTDDGVANDGGDER